MVLQNKFGGILQMKLKKLTKMMVAFLGVLLIVPMMFFAGCKSKAEKETVKIEQFYSIVVQSQGCLDDVADDIYSYWYDAIYDDLYDGDISLAVYYAKKHNSENLSVIEANEPKIKSLYKEIRDSVLSDQIKAVMSAYTDYYELVVNVSGSFKSYSADKETLKKNLASALKDLALEI